MLRVGEAEAVAYEHRFLRDQARLHTRRSRLYGHIDRRHSDVFACGDTRR